MTTEMFTSRPFTEEDFAEWLDGNLSPEEELDFLQNSENDPFFAELLDANDQIDADYELLNETGYELPQELFTDFELPTFGDVQDDYGPDAFVQADFQPADLTDNDNDPTDSDFGHGDAHQLDNPDIDNNAADDFDCMAF